MLECHEVKETSDDPWHSHGIVDDFVIGANGKTKRKTGYHGFSCFREFQSDISCMFLFIFSAKTLALLLIAEMFYNFSDYKTLR